MWPDISDPEEIKKRIAVIGVHSVQMQKLEESFVEDNSAIDQYKNMVGEQSSYSIADLMPPPPAESIIPEIPTQTV